jgi:hypothetical protein
MGCVLLRRAMPTPPRYVQGGRRLWVCDEWQLLFLVVGNRSHDPCPLLPATMVNFGAQMHNQMLRLWFGRNIVVSWQHIRLLSWSTVSADCR